MATSRFFKVAESIYFLTTDSILIFPTAVVKRKKKEREIGEKFAAVIAAASGCRVPERVTAEFLGGSPKINEIFREISVKNCGVVRLPTGEFRSEAW